MSKLEILSPVNGTLVLNTKIKDETFSKNMMGECFGVIPSNNLVYALVSGKITLILVVMLSVFKMIKVCKY